MPMRGDVSSVLQEFATSLGARDPKTVATYLKEKIFRPMSYTKSRRPQQPMFQKTIKITLSLTKSASAHYE